MLKKILCLLCALTTLLFLCSCTHSNSYEANVKEYMRTTPATKESVKDFISLLEKAEPSGYIAGYEIKSKNCYNVTPLAVASETEMKIFKFSDSCESFVMIDNEIYSLCASFGGYGFVNALPCDFDNDGNKDLLVASSWGSGMHRSIISIFNSVSKESTLLYEAPYVDLIVAKSTANIFTDNPEIDEKFYCSVLSVEINVVNDNWAKLTYVCDGIEGHIEVNDGVPTFKPYQNDTLNGDVNR